MGKLTYHEDGLGVAQFVNDEIALVGGFRTGKFGTEGTVRLRFSVFDMVAYREGRPEGRSDVGFVEINVVPDTHDIEGLVNIEIKRPARGKGYGRKVVDAILANAAGELRIYDVKPKAVDFWEHMGFSLERDRKSRTLNGSRPASAPEHSPAMARR